MHNTNSNKNPFINDTIKNEKGHGTNALVDVNGSFIIIQKVTSVIPHATHVEIKNNSHNQEVYKFSEGFNRVVVFEGHKAVYEIISPPRDCGEL